MVTKMGIEDDIKALHLEIFEVKQMVSLLLKREQPKDRQDKEKAIKDSLRDDYILKLDNINEHTE